MRRGLVRLDRVLTAALGLVFVAAGLVGLDWRYHVVYDGYADRLDLGRVSELADQRWWPWAFATAAVLLGLAGLLLALAHLRRDRPRRTTVSTAPRNGGESVSVTVDLTSVATAAASQLAAAGPLESVTGTTRTLPGGPCVELRARLRPGASLDEVAAASDRVLAALREAGLTGRVLADAPRRQPARRVQ